MWSLSFIDLDSYLCSKAGSAILQYPGHNSSTDISLHGHASPMNPQSGKRSDFLNLDTGLKAEHQTVISAGLENKQIFGWLLKFPYKFDPNQLLLNLLKENIV